MFLLRHEDARGCDYREPVTFETASAAVEYDAARADKPLPKGHAIILYECREVRVLRGDT